MSDTGQDLARAVEAYITEHLFDPGGVMMVEWWRNCWLLQDILRRGRDHKPTGDKA